MQSGPLPESDYVFTARLDPAQAGVDQANKRGDVSVNDAEQGIQFLPVGGNGPVFPQWARCACGWSQGGRCTTGRVLPAQFAQGLQPRLHRGRQDPRRAGLLRRVVAVRAEGGRANLVLRVKYPFPDMPTLGATRTP
jgi:hypothetical protein